MQYIWNNIQRKTLIVTLLLFSVTFMSVHEILADAELNCTQLELLEGSVEHMETDVMETKDVKQHFDCSLWALSDANQSVSLHDGDFLYSSQYISVGTRPPQTH